jgi:hypothetical protein
MDDRSEAEMMERDHIWRLVRAVGFAMVAIVGIIASCCVWFPWDPPKPSPPAPKTEAEQCAALCGSRPVTKFMSSGVYITPAGQPNTRTVMQCECGGQQVVAQ